jgi:hypothetical protein
MDAISRICLHPLILDSSPISQTVAAAVPGKKSFKIPKGYSESVNRRTDNTMAKSVKIPKGGNQNP